MVFFYCNSNMSHSKHLGSYIISSKCKIGKDEGECGCIGTSMKNYNS